MTPPANPIDIQGLTIRRDGRTILDRICWTVKPGEHWALLGANGSGKTTLLKALTAYTPPPAGSFRVNGYTYGQCDWRLMRREIGLVSSGLAELVPPWITAGRLTATGRSGALNDTTPIDENGIQQANTLLEEMDLCHLAERPWRALSQGERQRILIARALISRMTVLFLDEPCAGLDPVARERFLRFLARAAPRVPCIVLVTHHIEEVLPLISHVLLLKEGRVMAAGQKEDIMTSDTLSAAFGGTLHVRAQGDRFLVDASGDTP